MQGDAVSAAQPNSKRYSPQQPAAVPPHDQCVLFDGDVVRGCVVGEQGRIHPVVLELHVDHLVRPGKSTIHAIGAGLTTLFLDSRRVLHPHLKVLGSDKKKHISN